MESGDLKNGACQLIPGHITDCKPENEASPKYQAICQCFATGIDDPIPLAPEDYKDFMGRGRQWFRHVYLTGMTVDQERVRQMTVDIPPERRPLRALLKLSVPEDISMEKVEKMAEEVYTGLGMDTLLTVQTEWCGEELPHLHLLLVANERYAI